MTFHLVLQIGRWLSRRGTRANGDRAVADEAVWGVACADGGVLGGVRRGPLVHWWNRGIHRAVRGGGTLDRTERRADHQINARAELSGG